MEKLWQDVRYGLRSLLKRPGFALIIVATLALGIGANTVIFSAVNAVMLRPLPFEAPDRLVRIWETNIKRDITAFSASVPNFTDWKQQNQSFEQLAAITYANFNLTDGEQPERLSAQAVTYNLFDMLGQKTALGRSFLPEEDSPGRNRVIIVGNGLWQRRFGSDPGLIGRSITLNGESHTVVGVAPAEFGLGSRTDLWRPLGADLPSERRDNHMMTVVGKLKPGIALEQARAEMESISQRLEQQYPDSNSGWGVRIETFYNWIVDQDLRRMLLVLLGAVGFLLLIACANVANLLLARATARHREISIRAALGASRLRLIRQLLTESFLLSVMGGIAGILLALWGVDLLRTSGPESVPRLNEIGIDWNVLGFTAAISILVGLLFGLAPALQISKVDLHESLKEGGRSSSSGRRGFLRNGLAVAELSLSLVLLIGAALLMQSFLRLQNVKLGFNPENVITAKISLPDSKYPTDEAGTAFYKQLMERVKSLPGVKSVGLSSGVPFSAGNTSLNVTVEGNSALAPGESLQADWRIVSSDYFRAMEIPILKGRFFTDEDSLKAEGAMIISEETARRLLAGEDPIGRKLNPGGGTNLYKVVGVVGNVRNSNPAREANPAMYFNSNQGLWPTMTLIARTSIEPKGIAAAIRDEVKAVDKDLPVFSVQTMGELIEGRSAQPKFNTWLFSLFAMTALVLATIGIYGVISYSVEQRTHEIGIRMALGAERADVLRMIVGHGLRLAAAGVMVGLLAAYALTRFMENQLYGVSATDPGTFAFIALLLLAVSFAACYIPARRAAKVDPMVALRYE